MTYRIQYRHDDFMDMTPCGSWVQIHDPINGTVFITRKDAARILRNARNMESVTITRK